MPEVYAEGLRYFMGEGTINKTLARLANDLERRGIDYMVIGAIALLAHGSRGGFCRQSESLRQSKIFRVGSSSQK